MKAYICSSCGVIGSISDYLEHIAFRPTHEKLIKLEELRFKQ